MYCLPTSHLYCNHLAFLYRKLRSLEAGHLLINLSFGLLGIYIMFIICLVVAGKEQDVLCAVVGGILHYFLLVTFFLMAAEAVNLYIKLVVVLGAPYFIKNRYVLKVALISWSKFAHES